jgi:hypothetical protein
MARAGNQPPRAAHPGIVCALAASQVLSHILVIDPAKRVAPAGSGDPESLPRNLTMAPAGTIGWSLSGFPVGISNT